ncbi:MAG TPA: pilus assembly protein TadG-related protein [Fimbriiglobus sp.]|nr:pilus assembly protein TadG-related protein [Fimbriiglobus sp.]
MISPLARTRQARRPGNVLALFALLLTSLVGMVAFAIDTGYIALYKTRMQRAADAGALAGAQAALSPPGTVQNEAAVRAEVRTFVTHNMPGLTVRDEDIKLCQYIPYNAAGSRLSYTYSVDNPANAVEVTLRRDGLANSPLDLFFAPVIGTRNAALTVKAVGYCSWGKSIKAGGLLLPYAMQYDYYYAAMGLSRTGVDGNTIQVTDNAVVDPTTLAVTSGSDGIYEVVLFSDKQNAPGNFGSLNLGSSQNTTGELERQILYGPTAADFANPDFVFQVNPADGSLYIPFDAGGDTGMSTSVKTSFEAIMGQPRIIPLYGPAPGPDGLRGTADDTDGNFGSDPLVDGVYGTGATAKYHIIGYAGVVITSVNFNGSQKGITVQPAFLASNKVTPADSAADAVIEGVYLPPKLVIP